MPANGQVAMLAAFEANRREHRWHTAVVTLEATGAAINSEEPISWSWTNGTPDDIADVVDGAPLVDAWNDLILPAELRRR